MGMVICANCLYSLDFSNHSGFFFRAQTFWNGSFCLELVQDLCSRKFAAWGLAKHVCAMASCRFLSLLQSTTRTCTWTSILPRKPPPRSPGSGSGWLTSTCTLAYATVARMSSSISWVFWTARSRCFSCFETLLWRFEWQPSWACYELK